MRPIALIALVIGMAPQALAGPVPPATPTQPLPPQPPAPPQTSADCKPPLVLIDGLCRCPRGYWWDAKTGRCYVVK